MPRVKKDWVYTNDGYAIDPMSLQAGSDNAVAIGLTISQNARREMAYGSPGVEPVWADYNQVQSGAAFPEGAGMRIYGVDVTLLVLPQDWLLSTFFRLGMRLMHQEQDNADGQMVVSNGYSMFEGVTPDTINQWANAGFMKEDYKAESWQGSVGGLVTRVHFVYKMRWRSRRGLRIANDRAVYLYLESDFNSRGLTIWKRCRTLVSVTAP